MCGIAGYSAAQAMDGPAMLKALHHRGPDHYGAFEATAGGKQLFLGHTRLSILDLSPNGNQPMYSADQNIALIFNGEIYNFKELRRQHLRDHSFNSETDTEVLLKLYEQEGIRCVERLNGDFAFAIYDKRLGRMFLGRDRVGVKPLYYYTSGDKFVFASEIKAILAAGVRPELNEEEILNFFVFKYSPQNRTLYKNIHRVPPASVLTLDLNSGSISINKYWSLRKSGSRLSYQDAKDQIHALLEDSVRMRLVSDVPVGNFLSGGLDSSIIASFLQERKDIVHYCAKKDESDLKKEGTSSDNFYAAKLAQEWNLKLMAAPIGSEEASLEMIRTTLRFSEDLIADGSQIPSYLITREATKTSKVILSGMGADELFLGYAGHMLTLLDARVLHRMPASLGTAIGRVAASVDPGKGKFLAYRRYVHKLGKYSQLPRYRYALYNIVGDFENSCSVFAGDRTQIKELLSAYFPEGEDAFDALGKFEMENFLVKNLHYTDRMSMANSVECRVPFLDHRVIELAFNLPLHYKLSLTGKFKRILKDAFAQQVPSYILQRRKAGFGMPLRSIFGQQAQVDRLLDRAFFANFNKFSGENIERIVREHIAGKEDNSSIIYALVSFQEWYKLNFA